MPHPAIPDATLGAAVLCVGEVLWDALPTGTVLGGAPFNVACHLAAAGVPAAMVSRIGDDALGREALRIAAERGVDASLVQVDPALPTGVVRVALDARGDASYAIADPAAWDRVAWGEALGMRAAAARAIVFGSLAQRHDGAGGTRATIDRLLGAAEAGGAMRVFDVNLRAPYDDVAVVARSLACADLVKLNDDEVRRLAGPLGIPGGLRDAAAAIAGRWGARLVCVTRGAGGAALWHRGAWTEHPGYRVAVRDTVGAGDAFLAALLAALLGGADDAAALERANRVGAYVASREGAVPAYDAAAIAAIG